MTALLTLHSISKSFGSVTLFKEISFSIQQGDKIGLIGPNGAGKSTLLKILMNEEKEDSGFISKKSQLSIGYSSQAPEFEEETLEEVLKKEISHGDPVEILTRSRILLGKAEFKDFLQIAKNLSGGQKKRLDIARSLMKNPDLLILDEPTNHLDLEGIIWLENLLKKEKISTLIVSHDRTFLGNVCNKMVEINRCYKEGIFISEGSLETYQIRKEEFLMGQLQEQKSLNAKVKEEIAWLKKSPKARTTKSRSRIKQADELITELSQIKQRNKIDKVDIEFSASERATRKLLVAKNLSKSLGGKTLFSGVDILLSPGSCLGIVGKNGTGKTTLLKILGGLIKEDTGTIKYAEDLKLVYFDQHRESIPENISLKRALAPFSDTVNYRGQLIHVNGWAKKFLFDEDRLEMAVKYLSGGEKARILIAKLMLEPADLLFLDEPTNDLDITTLEVIEESLKEFQGAIVLISHDRSLMDNVCTNLLALGDGSEPQFFADYRQWEESLKGSEVKKIKKNEKIIEEKAPAKNQKKLSYKENQELLGIEPLMIKIEKDILSLREVLAADSNLADSKKTLENYTLLAKKEEQLDELFHRWQWLVEKNQ